jgi:hypothetical protein
MAYTCERCKEVLNHRDEMVFDGDELKTVNESNPDWGSAMCITCHEDLGSQAPVPTKSRIVIKSKFVTPDFDLTEITARYAAGNEWTTRECSHWINMLKEKGYTVTDRADFFYEVRYAFKKFDDMMHKDIGKPILETTTCSWDEKVWEPFKLDE